MILKKLKQLDHDKTRPLWERVFAEDTRDFLNYYYSIKTEDNEIYVIEMDGEIHSMLHLNPYMLRVGKKEEPSRYIVAVATDQGYRGKGYMTELLRKSIRDMYQKKMPFAFLMPAAKEIYYPHNFRFIYDADQWEAKMDSGEAVKIEELMDQSKGKLVKLKKAKMTDCKRLAFFAESVLKEKYQVYASRDWLYYEGLIEEQESQKGGILLVEVAGIIRGCFIYDEEAGFAVREPLFEEGYESVLDEYGLKLVKKEKKKPMIMGRILHVESLLSGMVCKLGMEVNLQFILVDPVIRENNKLFIIKGNSEHLVVRTKPVGHRNTEDVQWISIDALTSVLFGYKSLEAIEEEEQETFSDEFKEEIRKIDVLNRVFLNEIV